MFRGQSQLDNHAFSPKSLRERAPRALVLSRPVIPTWAAGAALAAAALLLLIFTAARAHADAGEPTDGWMPDNPHVGGQASNQKASKSGATESGCKPLCSKFSEGLDVSYASVAVDRNIPSINPREDNEILYCCCEYKKEASSSFSAVMTLGNATYISKLADSGQCLDYPKDIRGKKGEKALDANFNHAEATQLYKKLKAEYDAMVAREPKGLQIEDKNAIAEVFVPFKDENGKIKEGLGPRAKQIKGALNSKAQTLADIQNNSQKLEGYLRKSVLAVGEGTIFNHGLIINDNYVDGKGYSFVTTQGRLAQRKEIVAFLDKIKGFNLAATNQAIENAYNNMADVNHQDLLDKRDPARAKGRADVIAAVACDGEAQARRDDARMYGLTGQDSVALTDLKKRVEKRLENYSAACKAAQKAQDLLKKGDYTNAVAALQEASKSMQSAPSAASETEIAAARNGSAAPQGLGATGVPGAPSVPGTAAAQAGAAGNQRAEGDAGLRAQQLALLNGNGGQGPGAQGPGTGPASANGGPGLGGSTGDGDIGQGVRNVNNEYYVDKDGKKIRKEDASVTGSGDTCSTNVMNIWVQEGLKRSKDPDIRKNKLAFAEYMNSPDMQALKADVEEKYGCAAANDSIEFWQNVNQYSEIISGQAAAAVASVGAYNVSQTASKERNAAAVARSALRERANVAEKGAILSTINTAKYGYTMGNALAIKKSQDEAVKYGAKANKGSGVVGSDTEYTNVGIANAIEDGSKDNLAAEPYNKQKTTLGQDLSQHKQIANKAGRNAFQSGMMMAQHAASSIMGYLEAGRLRKQARELEDIAATPTPPQLADYSGGGNNNTTTTPPSYSDPSSANTTESAAATTTTTDPTAPADLSPPLANGGGGAGGLASAPVPPSGATVGPGTSTSVGGGGGGLSGSSGGGSPSGQGDSQGAVAVTGGTQKFESAGGGGGNGFAGPGGGNGGHRVSDTGGMNFKELVDAFIKPEEAAKGPAGRNLAFAIDADRAPAGMGVDDGSILGKNANLFIRVSNTTMGYYKRGSIK